MDPAVFYADRLPAGAGVCVCRKIVYKSHLQGQPFEGSFFGMRRGIVGMEKGIREDRCNEKTGHDPAEGDLSGFSLDAGEKKKQGIDTDEIPVAQCPTAPRIIVRHDHDIKQNPTEDCGKKKPLIDPPGAQNKKDEREDRREKIPREACKPAEEIIKQIVEHKFYREEVFFHVAL